jgi:hypothetical protein
MALRLALQLLTAKAVFLSEDGHHEKALALLAAGARVVRHSGEEPTMVTLLLLPAFIEIWSDGFHQVLKRCWRDEGALRLAKVTHQAAVMEPDLVHYLRGEALFGLAASRKPASFLLEPDLDVRTPAEKQADRKLARYPEALLQPALETRLLAFYRRLFDSVRASQGEPLARHGTLMDLANRERAQKEPSYRVSRDVASWVEGYSLAAMRCIAYQRLRGASLLVLEHRRPAGASPARLPDLPLDPFDGKPLRYLKKGSDLLLYSIGPNLKDDRGSTNQGETGPLDLVVTLPG